MGVVLGRGAEARSLACAVCLVWHRNVAPLGSQVGGNTMSLEFRKVHSKSTNPSPSWRVS